MSFSSGSLGLRPSLIFLCMDHQLHYLKNSFFRFGTAITGPGGQINNMKLKSSSGPRWRRVVFKISGAALAGTTQNNIDPKVYM